jgi:3-phosphoshikimate 1-carboxyvinyltransferase
MHAHLDKSQINGEVSAPPSKSYTIRGLMCAALAQGESRIVHPLLADDTTAASWVLDQIGVLTKQVKGEWLVRGGNFHAPDLDLFCGDSAATLRFMTAVCALVPGTCRLTAGASLSNRPVRVLIEALRRLGVEVSSQNDAPPVTVRGGTTLGNNTSLPGDVSSQYVSALLLIAPLAENGMQVKLTTPLESKPYVEMTLECLRQFGIQVEASPDYMTFRVSRQAYCPATYEVEGDWSSASYWLALGALAGEVTIDRLNRRSLQGDKSMLDWLAQMGADISRESDPVVIRKSRLKGINIDLTDAIDMLPTMAILAATAKGTSVLSGIARARIKESDRVAAVKEGLERLGIAVTEEENRLTVQGGKLQSAVIDSKGDHRVAMAFGTLGAAAGGITITGAECVSKTYPGFWDELKSLGGKVKIDG